MENKNNNIADNSITLEYKKGSNLNIVKNSKNGMHSVSFDDYNDRHIYENSDGSWVYHEETDPKHDSFFNIHLKKDGSFAYSNESIPPVYAPKEDLFESHKFIIEIVDLIEKVKSSINEKENKKENSSNSKEISTHEDEER